MSSLPLNSIVLSAKATALWLIFIFQLSGFVEHFVRWDATKRWNVYYWPLIYLVTILWAPVFTSMYNLNRLFSQSDSFRTDPRLQDASIVGSNKSLGSISTIPLCLMSSSRLAKSTPAVVCGGAGTSVSTITITIFNIAVPKCMNKFFFFFLNTFDFHDFF